MAKTLFFMLWYSDTRILREVTGAGRSVLRRENRMIKTVPSKSNKLNEKKHAKALPKWTVAGARAGAVLPIARKRPKNDRVAVNSEEKAAKNCPG